MKTLNLKDTVRKVSLKIIITAFAAGFLVYAAFHCWVLYKKWEMDMEKVAKLEEYSQTVEKIFQLKTKENQDLLEKLSLEQSKNKVFASQIGDLRGIVGDISGNVNTLEKLRKLDSELLEKYSKIYFLSENYIPAQLSIIDTQYLYNQNKPEQFYSQALPFLQNMIEAAKGEGVILKIVSAYRSFDQQAAIKSGYKITYGSGANQFSADQGYSEHQLGTTCDFTTPETKAVFSKFEGTSAYKWLRENAYKFGFELSYPKDNSYYEFEPWHWRFVGVALATRLHDENKNFYELAQREIDPYLISIFD